jgi:uncharacterized protein involved in exopolysaccharide biosynthesis
MKDIEMDFLDERHTRLDLRGWLLKYWSYKWPIAIICGSCLLIAAIYALITPSTYKVKATITINDSQRGGAKNSGLSQDNIFSTATDWINTENEIEKLKSPSLVEKVVMRMKLYSVYTTGGRMRNKLLYEDIPVTVDINETSLEKLTSPISMDLEVNATNNIGVNIKTIYQGEPWEKETAINKFPQIINTPAGDLEFLGSMDAFRRFNDKLHTTIVNPSYKARECVSQLTAMNTSRSTSIVNLEYNSRNRAMGLEFLSELVRCYNIESNADKNRIAMRTSDFLKDRLDIISKELNATDNQLQDYKRGAGVTNMYDDTKTSLEEEARYGREALDAETQMSRINSLSEYIHKPENIGSPIPGATGLTDPNLASTINSYNQLVSEYQRLATSSSENNPVLRNLKNQMEAGFKGVEIALKNAYDQAAIAKNKLSGKVGQYNQRISKTPVDERIMTSITRQQDTKSSIYLDLLQKMEATAMALDAITEDAKIINKPYSAQWPTSPKKKVIMGVALLIGLLLSLLWVYFKEQLSKKIADTHTMRNMLGEAFPIVSMRTDRKLSENQKFGNMRTIVRSILNRANGGTVFLNSYNKNDGKSVVASALADNYAKTGDKTLLLTIRSAANEEERRNINFYLEPSDKHLSEDLVFQSEINENFWTLPITLSNDDMVAFVCDKRLDGVIKQMKERFEKVIINTVAIKDVPDEMILGKYADVAVMVMRPGNTDKRAVEVLNNAKQNNLLPYTLIVINENF